jgi:hypothetical protein
MNGFLKRLLEEVETISEISTDRIAEKFGDIKKENGEEVVCRVTGKFSKKTYTLLLVVRKKLSKLMEIDKNNPLSSGKKVERQKLLKEIFILQRKKEILENVFLGQIADKIKNYENSFVLNVRKDWLVVILPSKPGFAISLN